jgi:ATP-dependent HslUV protease ATP-binding subunit HslU
MLFICAGAFNISKPQDILPELLGRLPVRVDLNMLTKKDFK